MGVISLTNASRLYWLGRYTERVYTGLKETQALYDAFVDGREADYKSYCAKMGIPAEYADTADFCKRYFFDENNGFSLISALHDAYDNAVVLRDTLTTVTLSYMQLAVNAMEDAAKSPTPAVLLQLVQDDIMAFRGSCEESISTAEARATIKLGANVERVDLYLRLGRDPEEVRQVFELLFNRLYRTQLSPDKEKLDLLVDSLLDSSMPDLPSYQLIGAVEGLFPRL